MKRILPLILVVCVVFGLCVHASAAAFVDLPYSSLLNYNGRDIYLEQFCKNYYSNYSAFATADRLIFMEGSIYVDGTTIRNTVDQGHIFTFVYVPEGKYWDYEAYDYYDAGVNIGNLSNVIWSKYDLVTDQGIVVFEGDPKFKPTYNEVVEESLLGLGNNILDTVGVLLPVGLVVMGSVIVVGLLRKKKLWHV